jgi:hypothetical protein
VVQDLDLIVSELAIVAVVAILASQAQDWLIVPSSISAEYRNSSGILFNVGVQAHLFRAADAPVHKILGQKLLPRLTDLILIGA